MARLPMPGGDNDAWGDILNTFLEVSHNIDGSLQNSSVKNAGAVMSVNGTTPISGDVAISASSLGAYELPATGIPTSDLSATVQNDLSSASSAVQVGGDISGTKSSPTIISTHLAAALPIDQGGTGSSVKNFVDISTNQTISGVKTFSRGISKRSTTLSASANIYSPNCDTTDLAVVNAPVANFTIASPAGVPLDGQGLTLRIISGGTGYAPSWGSGYLSSSVATLPTSAFSANRTFTLNFTYDANRSQWILFAFDSVGY